MTNIPRLLSEPTNFAVVQLPGRNFSGVVIQGDTLHPLVQQINDMERLLGSGSLNELAGEIADMKEQLSDALSHYERICIEQEINLPYTKSA